MAFAVPHSAVASMVYDLLFQARESDRCPETGPSAANIGRPLPQGLAEFNPLECPSHDERRAIALTMSERSREPIQMIPDGCLSRGKL
jgi:hypothetical protein